MIPTNVIPTAAGYTYTKGRKSFRNKVMSYLEKKRMVKEASTHASAFSDLNVN
jgi:hypothetical protein